MVMMISLLFDLDATLSRFTFLPYEDKQKDGVKGVVRTSVDVSLNAWLLDSLSSPHSSLRISHHGEISTGDRCPLFSANVRDPSARTLRDTARAYLGGPRGFSPSQDSPRTSSSTSMWYECPHR